MTLRQVGGILLAIGLLQMPIDQVGSQTGSSDPGQSGEQLINPSRTGKLHKVAADPEENLILAAARPFVRANSVPQAKFNLRLTKRVGKWALVQVIPVRPFITDEAMLVMEKTDRGWIGRTMGTDLSDWEQRLPELFR